MEIIEKIKTMSFDELIDLRFELSHQKSNGSYNEKQLLRYENELLNSTVNLFSLELDRTGYWESRPQEVVERRRKMLKNHIEKWELKIEKYYALVQEEMSAYI